MAARAQATFRGGNPAGLLAKVASGLYDGVVAAANLVYDEAVARCPVDTGALVSSIGIDVQRGIQSVQMGGPIQQSMFSVSAQIAPHVDYAAYVEFGTGVRGASSAGAGPGPYNPAWPGMAAQ